MREGGAPQGLSRPKWLVAGRAAGGLPVEIVCALDTDTRSRAPEGCLNMTASRSIVPVERIERAILFIRGQKVMLSFDLAVLYGVETRALVQAVKRNRDRFPADFMFQLTPAEWADLKSQFVISSWGGARRGRPYAFSEQGVAMLSSVLKSKRAVRVNVEIMRAFVRLRRVLAANAALARRLDELERRVGQHDEQFVDVIRAIRELMEPPPAPKKGRIGFRPHDER